MQPQVPILQVAAKAAIVDGDGKVLIVREAESGPNNTIVGRYTLVGGRIDPGEAFIEGLKREILEETGLIVTPKLPLQIGEWRPVIRGIEHQIIAIFPMIEPDCFVADGLINDYPRLLN